MYEQPCNTVRYKEMEQNYARKQKCSPEINSREMEVYGVQGQINKHY